jgi:hypothetical protein
VAGASVAAAGLAFARTSPGASGAFAGLLVVALVGYSGVKRSPRVTSRLRSVKWLSRAAYVAHLSLGALAAGAVAAHVGARLGSGVALSLTIAMIVALATGAFGAAMHALLPPRISRLERRSVLPEELRARAREIDEGLFAKLSGKSELVKALFGKALRPYVRSRLGPILLVASGRTLREEERRLRASLDALLEHKRSDKLAGIDELVRAVVELRGVRAQRVLSFVVRGWVFLHLGATGAAIVLLVAHVVSVWRSP